MRPANDIDLEDTSGSARSVYLSPKDLARRWSCSCTSAQRIAEREGISRFLLGHGRNGMVRYPLAEIEAYEQTRQFKPLAASHRR